MHGSIIDIVSTYGRDHFLAHCAQRAERNRDTRIARVGDGVGDDDGGYSCVRHAVLETEVRI